VYSCTAKCCMAKALVSTARQCVDVCDQALCKQTLVLAAFFLPIHSAEATAFRFFDTMAPLAPQRERESLTLAVDVALPGQTNNARSSSLGRPDWSIESIDNTNTRAVCTSFKFAPVCAHPLHQSRHRCSKMVLMQVLLWHMKHARVASTRDSTRSTWHSA
jgi:hypothetical protein